MITPNQIIRTIDGPFYAPNYKRTVRVIRKSDVIGAWVCTDLTTGEELVIQEFKLRQSIKDFGEEPSTNPS